MQRQAQFWTSGDRRKHAFYLENSVVVVVAAYDRQPRSGLDIIRRTKIVLIDPRGFIHFSDGGNLT